MRRVQHVDVDRQVQRVVPHPLTYRGGDVVDAHAPDVYGGDDLEAEFGVLRQVGRGVQRPADADVHAVPVKEQPVLAEARRSS
jgi:hypothetical protein